MSTSAVFLLNKAAGISSFAALGALKRSLNTRKAGHAGTLDPFASGLLIAMSGRMTRAAGLLSSMDKRYRAVFRFGEETDTLDSEGGVIARAPVPGRAAIEQAAGAFSGEVSQVPPAYSAVKIQGRRAYSLARRGQAVQMPSRLVTIYSLELINWSAPDLEVAIHCSKGTYIRSIARDLGLACGSRAFCAELRRDAVGPFKLSESVPAEECTPRDGMAPPAFFERLGVPLRSAGDRAARQLRQGVVPGRISGLEWPSSEACLYVDKEGRAAAFLELREGRWHYRIVFD